MTYTGLTNEMKTRAKHKITRSSTFLLSSEHIWVWNDRKGKKMTVRWAIAQLAQSGQSHDEVHRRAPGLCGLCTEEVLSDRGRGDTELLCSEMISRWPSAACDLHPLFFFFYLFQLNCLQCRNVELPLKTHLFLTTLTRHKHTLTYSPFNRLDPYVFAGYDLFVCSDQSCQRCLKTTNRQQVTTAETKALEEAHGAKEIIGRRDCWCVQVWLWGADGA